jgi:hypothetical protein
MKLQRSPTINFRGLLLVVLLVVFKADAFMTTRSNGWGRYQSVSRQSIVRPLHVAKSGGKMILTEDMYSENVLSKDIPKPVLVFFSAPWYVLDKSYFKL